jgi:nitrogen fixation-related uncharacterized protein
MMRTITIVAFAVGVLVIAGLGFAYKMTEFAVTIAKDDVEGFGAVAISVYLIGMLPLLFLMLWAVVTGQFRDLERQKYRLFELEREIELGGGMRFVVPRKPSRTAR